MYVFHMAMKQAGWYYVACYVWPWAKYWPATKRGRRTRQFPDLPRATVLPLHLPASISRSADEWPYYQACTAAGFAKNWLFSPLTHKFATKTLRLPADLQTYLCSHHNAGNRRASFRGIIKFPSRVRLISCYPLKDVISQPQKRVGSWNECAKRNRRVSRSIQPLFSFFSSNQVEN